MGMDDGARAGFGRSSRASLARRPLTAYGSGEMRRAQRVLCGSLVAAAAAFATAGRADDTDSAPTPVVIALPDTVYLKNGGLLRGTLIDVIPGVQARIKLPTGEVSIIPWSEIARIDARSTPVTPEPSVPRAPPAPVPPPAKAHVLGPTVVVHLESSKPVKLERYDAERPNWDELCASPCDIPVPADGEYRIVGNGVLPSSGFHLEPSADGRVVLDVSSSSRFWRDAGGGMLGGGILTALYGHVWYGMGASFDGQPDAATQSVANGYKTVGAVLMVGGGVIAGIGTLLMLGNWSTSVSQSVRAPSESARGVQPLGVFSF